MKPRRGSLIRRSSISATITWIRSAILRTRGLVILSRSLGENHRLTGELHGSVEKVQQVRGRFTTYAVNLPPPAKGLGARDLTHLEGLHDIAFLDVLEVPEHQTALEALADLGRVVLLPLQRGEVEV